jgi:hypothetical protein
MTDPKIDRQPDYWAACHSAIIAWAKPQFDNLAKQTIENLKKQPAVGMFEAEYRFRNYWDEYSHEVQNGPFMEEWHETVEAFCHGVVEAIDRPSLTLLSIAAIEDQGEDEDTVNADGIWPDLVVRVVQEALNQAASERDLDHFSRDFEEEADEDENADDEAEEDEEP